MHNWNDSLKGVLFGALTGIAVGLGGFILTEIPRTHARRYLHVKGALETLRSGCVAGFLLEELDFDWIGDGFTGWVIHGV
ncbi:MAG: hypothetical protein WB723_19940, partial [Candidatus Acidiferrales bacterium]